MAEENVEVVRQLFEAFNRDDVTAVLEAFDEDCEFYEPAEMPDTPATGFRGHEGIRRWMRNLRETGGIEFEPTAFSTSGDVILSEWIGRGLGQASRAPIEWKTFAVMRMRDGKVLRLQAFLDRDEAIEAAGLWR
jgi:ketosteroid isomerase-like protein